MSFDSCDSSQPSSVRRLSNRDDEIHRLADELWLRRHIRFLNQGFKPDECRLRTGGMNSRKPAGMARVPCLEKRQRFGATELADDDPVGPQPHCRAEQTKQVRRLGRVQIDSVRMLTAKLGQVLKDYCAMRGIELHQQRTGK